MKNKIPVLIIINFFLGYLLLNLIYSGSGYNNQYYVLISVATILFGIFIAFSIYNNQTKITRIKELLRSDDANLISLYKQSVVFGEEVQKDLQKLIDKYLIAQIDYRLIDFRNSTDQFIDIYDYILKLTPKSDKQVSCYESILDIAEKSFENRKLVEVLVKQKMTSLEWLSLFTLEIMIGYIVLVFDNKSFLGSILSSMIVTTGVVLLIVLRELDKLSWQENSWIWIPLHNLFISVGLLPYYPDIVLQDERAQIPLKGKVRVGHYKYPYPDMREKNIEVLEVK